MKNDTHRLLKSGMALSLVCLILCTPSISLGWGAGGHMMVAQIAFKRLNPKAKSKANELLAIKIPTDPPVLKSADFVNAAHWADDIRPVVAFKDFIERHFIDTPFTTDGTALPAVSDSNIVTALESQVEILRTSTDKQAQAQALRFIIHFVGDIHQPLHAATRVDSAHTTGDRGGNDVVFKLVGADKSTNLHSYWDGGIGSFPPTGPHFKPPPLSLIPAAVAKATAGNPDTDPGLKLNEPFAFRAWADESFALARDVAYKGRKNGVRPNATYNAAALKVARQRVAWGGYRLAALLNAIWPQ